MNVFLNDFIFPLIPTFCFLGMCFECRKLKKHIKELEDENEDLRSRIEWDL